jgi:hypothetical protein
MACKCTHLAELPLQQPMPFAAESKKRAGKRRTNHESKVREDKLKRAPVLFALLMTLAISSGLWAQQAGYSQTNLVSNTAGVANTTDTQLLNPGESRFFPGKISGSPTTTAAPLRS